MPKRIFRWFDEHPNLFAFTLVVIVFIWSIIRIGHESKSRIDFVHEHNQEIQAEINKESRARQEIICLVLTDGVDRDKALIDALVAASQVSPVTNETEEEKRRRSLATKIFFEKLEPSLRPIECKKFVKDPINYLSELRERIDFNKITTTTVPR